MRTIRLSFPWRRVVALFFACLVCTALWAEAAQSQLADKVIRLHVLANSDSQADQALKRYVRDQVLAQTTPLLEGVTSAPEAEAILQANLGLLTQTAQAAIAAQGYDYSVSVRLEETWFPTRQYQDVALPAGNYQALRVLIGEAEGHNWWCVIFPSLCVPATADGFADAAAAGGFTDAEISLMTRANGAYVVKFRSLELLQALKKYLFGE